MPRLDDDLVTYMDEVWTKKDVRAGLKIISELSGLVVVGSAVAAIVAFLIHPFLGARVSTAVAQQVARAAAAKYSELNAEQRKQVRSVMKFLGDQFPDVEL